MQEEKGKKVPNGKIEKNCLRVCLMEVEKKSRLINIPRERQGSWLWGGNEA